MENKEQRLIEFQKSLQALQESHTAFQAARAGGDNVDGAHASDNSSGDEDNFRIVGVSAPF